MKMRDLVKRLAIMGALGTTTISLGHAQTPEWDRVVAAAKKEGTVVLYSGVTILPDNLLAHFTAKYGIPVELLQARSTEIRERIRSEVAAGKVLGDMTLNSASTEELQLRAGHLQPHGALPNAARLPAQFASDGTRLIAMLGRWGMLVNTNLVKPEEVPATWTDVLDPKWQGKILIDDPRINGGGHIFFTAAYDKFGRGFHEKLAAQKPTISNNAVLGNRRLAQGEYAILIPFTLQSAVDLRGLPVKVVVPKEGAAFLGFSAALLKDAPHPNAARLFLNYLLEDEAQQMVVQKGYSSPLGGFAESAPPELKPFDGVALLGTGTADQQEPMMKLAQELYK